MKAKICNICKEAKAETLAHFSFYKNKNSSGEEKFGYRGTCKSCMAERTKKHSAANPEMVRARSQRRAENSKNAEGSYNADDIIKIRKNQNDQCYYCGTLLNGRGEVDHKQPLNKGGTHWPSNLVLACLTCNRDKHSKTAEEFFDWRKLRKLPCNPKFQ